MIDVNADVLAAIAAQPDAVDVVSGAHSTKGLLDQVDGEKLQHNGESIIGQATTLVIPTGSLGDLQRGAAITVSGKAFEFSFGMKQGDGREFVAYLVEV